MKKSQKIIVGMELAAKRLKSIPRQLEKHRGNKTLLKFNKSSQELVSRVMLGDAC